MCGLYNERRKRHNSSYFPFLVLYMKPGFILLDSQDIGKKSFVERKASTTK